MAEFAKLMTVFKDFSKDCRLDKLNAGTQKYLQLIIHVG